MFHLYVNIDITSWIISLHLYHVISFFCDYWTLFAKLMFLPPLKINLSYVYIDAVSILVLSKWIYKLQSNCHLSPKYLYVCFICFCSAVNFTRIGSEMKKRYIYREWENTLLCERYTFSLYCVNIFFNTLFQWVHTSCI